MKLSFERWLEENNLFCDEALNLLQEGILCYKIGTYKGAYLLSYMAFKNNIRNKALGAMKSKEYKNNAKLMKLLKRVQNNSETWENDIEPIIMSQKEEYNIFKLSEDIRKDYAYWKKIRNDCIHGKETIIDESVVGMFWNFLKINMIKFQINGDKEYLINEIFDAFRYMDEQYESNIEVLFNQLSSLNKEDIVDIIERLDNKISEVYECRYQLKKVYGLVDFWKKMLHHSMELQEALLEYIGEQFRRFNKFNNDIPELLALIIAYKRNFIDEVLTKEIIEDRFQHPIMWTYTIKILNDINISEAIKKRFIEDITKEAPISLPDKNTLEVLEKYEYIEIWRKKLIDNEMLNPCSYGIDYIADYYNRNNINFILKNIEWGKKELEVLNKIHTRTGWIEGAYAYYDFTHFQSQLSRDELYIEKIKKYYEKTKDTSLEIVSDVIKECQLNTDAE